MPHDMWKRAVDLSSCGRSWARQTNHKQRLRIGSHLAQLPRSSHSEPGDDLLHLLRSVQVPLGRHAGNVHVCRRHLGGRQRRGRGMVVTGQGLPMRESSS